MARHPNTAPIDPTDAFAQRLKSLEQQVAELQRARPWGSWTSITSGFTSSAGAVNLGTTGAVSGRYRRTPNGCEGWIKASWAGTGGTAGAGYYIFTLPVAAVNSPYLALGHFKAYANTTNMFWGQLELDNLSTTNARLSHAATSNGTAETMLGSGSGLGTTGGFVIATFRYETP